MSAAPGQPSISVVIATLCRADQLRTALETVVACDPPPLEIVVADGDDARSALAVTEELGGERREPPIRHLACERGLTRQRNQALRTCLGDVVVFFDDDVRVEPDVIGRLAAAYDDPAVVGATGRVLEPDARRFGRKESRVRRLLPGGGEEGGFTRFGYPRRLLDLDHRRDVSFMQGAFMSARLEVALRVGFDETLTGYGLAEDEDFSWRLSRIGRIRYLPDAVVHHDNIGFTTRDPRGFNRQVVVTRSYLFRKNFAPTRLARLQFALFVGVLFAHRLLNRDWAGAGGLLDGVRTVRRGRR